MPDGTAPLDQALVRLSNVVLDDATLDSVMQLVVALAVASIPASDAASVSVLRGGSRFETINATSSDVVELDDVQYDTGEGPCVEAMRSETTVVTDLAADARRWPVFAKAALDRGVTSIFSSPLQVRDKTIGGLNLYSHVAGSIEGWDPDTVSTFATSAAIVLANMTAYATSADQNTQLQRALVSRDVIGQAKGVLMERNGEDADQAFDRLRRMSQESNRKLHEIARDIVAATSGRHAGG